MNEICTCELMHLFQLSARAVIGLQLKQIPAAVFSGQQHLLFGAIHNSCKPSVKHRYSCFTTLSGGRCPPHSPPAREITSPLTPECRLRRFFIIYLKVNAVALKGKGRPFRERSAPVIAYVSHYCSLNLHLASIASVSEIFSLCTITPSGALRRTAAKFRIYSIPASAILLQTS